MVGNAHGDRLGGFILAAGEGRRLRPATLSCPKALVPFCGIPALRRVAERLASLDLVGLGLNVSYHGRRVAQAADVFGQEIGVHLGVSSEDTLLDTGGGLRRGMETLPDCDHVLVHNVDTVLDFDLRRLVQTHLASGAAATVLAVPERGPCTVELEADGTIRDFRRKPGAGHVTFAGVHIFRRDVLAFLPGRPVCSIIEAYEAALAAGESVIALRISDEDYWADLGTAASYIRAHGEIMDCALRFDPALRSAQSEQARRRAELEQSGVLCTGALGIGRNVRVPPGSHLHNVVLWDDTTLPAPLLYADGIFTGGTVPSAPPVCEDRTPDPRILQALDLSPPDSTTAAASPDYELTPLQKQGSGRRYCRLSDGERSWVWCAYDPKRRENASFAAISDFLSRIGVRVPQVALHLPDVFEMVSRDLGQHDLQHLPKARHPAYLEKVVRQVARLHVVGDQAARLEELPLQRGFTKGLYDWERDYFRHHLLGKVLGHPEFWSDAALQYCELRTRLLREPLVPIHRDLQSANIMIVGDEPYFIDFQGMRLGCAAYDLGALLYDPYQSYPRDVRNRAWEQYRACVAELGGRTPEAATLYAAAIQRLLQALGAYGKLWLKDGLEWYRPFIRSGLEMLAAAAESGGYAAMSRLAARCLESLPNAVSAPDATNRS